jgi:hypothetical protein
MTTFTSSNGLVLLVPFWGLIPPLMYSLGEKELSPKFLSFFLWYITYEIISLVDFRMADPKSEKKESMS